MSGPPVHVINNVIDGCFEVKMGGHRAFAEYTLDDGTMTIIHTEVPKPLEGQGIAGALVQAALAHARSEGLKVVPSCSYARGYMERHPETQDLLA